MATTQSIEEIVRSDAARKLLVDIEAKCCGLMFDLKQVGLLDQYKSTIDEMVAAIYAKRVEAVQQEAIAAFVDKVSNGG